MEIDKIGCIRSPELMHPTYSNSITNKPRKASNDAGFRVVIIVDTMGKKWGRIYFSASVLSN